jgi:tryptophanyl-tRNA synthetase
MMRTRYEAGGYGYGHAKKALLELVLDKYAKEREIFNTYMADAGSLEEILGRGEEKARAIAVSKMGEVREKLGFT